MSSYDRAPNPLDAPDPYEELRKENARLRELADGYNRMREAAERRAQAAENAVNILEAEIIEMDRERRGERFSPIGDNHHNALLCPYCSPKEG